MQSELMFHIRLTSLMFSGRSASSLIILTDRFRVFDPHADIFWVLLKLWS